MKSVFSAGRAKRASLALLVAGLITLGLRPAAAVLLDPTQPYGSGERVAAPATGLQSTVVGVADRRAVIDGRVYREGDRYGAAVVQEIRSYEVILREAGRTKRLRLVPALVGHTSSGQEGSNDTRQ